MKFPLRRIENLSHILNFTPNDTASAPVPKFEMKIDEEIWFPSLDTTI